MTTASGDDLAAGLAHLRAGRLDAAAALLSALVARAPGDAAALGALGRVALARRDGAEALRLFRLATRLRADDALLWDGLARALEVGRDPAGAEDAYAKALALDPRLADCAYRQGHLALARGDTGAAAARWRDALDRAPGHRDARIDLATLHLREGRFDAARGLLDEGLARVPGDGEILARLGHLERVAGRPAAAVAALERATRHAPGMGAVWNELGLALGDAGRHFDAARAFRRALSAGGVDGTAAANLARTLHESGDHDGAARALADGLARAPDDAALHRAGVVTPHYAVAFDAAANRRAAEAWCRRFLPPPPPRPAPATGAADPGRRLRVGYVSGDFSAHPVGIFLARVFAAHDRDAVEVVAYDTRDRRDGVNALLRRHAGRWRPIAALDDSAAAARVREDGIDVLFDLGGHTTGGRLGLFARRAAPVQASWLGYFGTTGLAAMDWLIADPVVVPEGEERHYTERVLRLPDAYLCFTPPADAPDVSPLPMLAAGWPTFGCCNSLAKVTDRTLDLWAAVLARVPGARLLVKARQLDDPAVGEHLARRLAGRGVAGDRLLLEGPSPRSEYLAGYARIDLVLDTAPFGGGTTTAEALWMGVPSLRLAGDRFAGRIGESLQRAAGVADMVAGSPADYVDRAAALVGDPDRLAALRAAVRARMAASPLCDAARFARNLEDACRTMWRAWATNE